MLALQRLVTEDRYEIVSLFTTMTEGVDRVSMHGVSRSLLHQQVSRLGYDVETMGIPPGCTNAIYDEMMVDFLMAWQLRGVKAVAFGDLFLEDIRTYREAKMQSIGMQAIFPIWGLDTGVLASEFVRQGFRARLVCVDTTQLAESFCGMEFEYALAQLPPGVDPCGERGEFHTFVYDGPMLSSAIAVAAGDKVIRRPFVFSDLVETVR